MYSVDDDGVGIPADKLDSINTQLSKNESNCAADSVRRMGLALFNINSRIRLLYGEDYGVSVASSWKRHSGSNYVAFKQGSNSMEELFRFINVSCETSRFYLRNFSFMFGRGNLLQFPVTQHQLKMHLFFC